jgi:hypothetical protein
MKTSYDIFLKLKDLEEEKKYLIKYKLAYQIDEFGICSEYGNNILNEEHIKKVSDKIYLIEQEIDQITIKMEKYLTFKKEIQTGYIRMKMHPRNVYNYMITHNIDLVELDFDCLLDI